MSLSEIGQLRYRIRQQYPGLRLFPDDARSGRFVLVDRASGAIEAEGLTAAEVRGFCNGRITLCQVRQAPAER